MTTSPPTPPPDTALYELAERFLAALLASADVSKIGPARWWERAKTALETAAASSTTFRQCVAKAGKKLEIETLREASSTSIAALAAQLDDPAVFARWRTLATRDALTITAMVRADRAARRNREGAPE